MKKTIKVISLFSFLILFSTICFATDFNHTAIPNLNTVGDEVMPINEDSQIDNISEIDKDIDISQDDMISKDDLYELKNEINYDELTLDGNAYFMGENINIKNSMINGNVFILGKEVNLENVQIYGSLYLLTDKSTLNIVVLDVYALGNDINIQKESSILRTVRIAGENIKISGNIDKSCYLTGTNIDLNSSIILGDLNYSAKEEINLDNTDVSGKINFNKIEENEDSEEALTVIENVLNSFKITKMLSTILSTFLIAGLILLISDKFNNISKNIEIGPFIGKSLLVGILSLILIPMLSLILMISIVGFGVGLLLLVLYIMVLINSISIVSLTIAINIFKEKTDTSKWIILGTTVLISLALYIINTLIWIIGVLTCILGLGIVIKTIFSKKAKKEENPIQIIDSNN